MFNRRTSSSVHALTGSPLARRELLTSVALAGAGLALASCAPPLKTGRTDSPEANLAEPDGLDGKIFTFACNLEFVESEYYTHGAYGVGIAQRGGHVGDKPGRVMGGRKVRFSRSEFQDYAEELAFNEAAHVAYYQKILGDDAPSRPAIDFIGGMTGMARAAGIIGPGETFDPFENEINFFLGGMLMEDNGICTYRGAAPLISDRTLLGNAAGILAVEAYHMGMVRSLLFEAGPEARRKANLLSDARDRLDGDEDLDEGIEMNGKANIVPCDRNGIVFSRTPRQSMNIICGNVGATKGGLLPEGPNGDVAALLAL